MLAQSTQSPICAFFFICIFAFLFLRPKLFVRPRIHSLRWWPKRNVSRSLSALRKSSMNFNQTYNELAAVAAVVAQSLSAAHEVTDTVRNRGSYTVMKPKCKKFCGIYK